MKWLDHNINRNIETHKLQGASSMVWNDGACIQTNWRNLHLASISWKTTSFHNSAEKKETLRQTAYWWIKLKRLAGKTKKKYSHTHT